VVYGKKPKNSSRKPEEALGKADAANKEML
jgi:hypothetical protein